MDFSLKMMQPMPEDEDGRGAYKFVSGDEDRIEDHEESHAGKDDDGFNLINERELIKKLDKRIMPCLFAMIVLK
jgi:hypothetical protein